MKYDKIEKLYNLKNLTRYNMSVRLRNESVAEHSYFTTMFVLLLCEELRVSNEIKLLAVEMALVHDIPETRTSDIPHPVKNSSPELANVVRDIEKQVMLEEYPQFFDRFCLLDKPYEVQGNARLAKLIVETADVLSVIQYANSEVNLGNSYMQEILDSSEIRLEKKNNELYKEFGINTTIVY